MKRLVFAAVLTSFMTLSAQAGDRENLMHLYGIAVACMDEDPFFKDKVGVTGQLLIREHGADYDGLAMLAAVSRKHANRYTGRICRRQWQAAYRKYAG